MLKSTIVWIVVLLLVSSVSVVSNSSARTRQYFGKHDNEITDEDYLLLPSSNKGGKYYMDYKNKSLFEIRARLLKAMAHPTRLYIINELEKSRHCVCELQKMIGDDTSTISKHLNVLKSAGIVKDEKEGLKVFYSLKVPCIINFFGCVDKVLETNAKEQLACIK